MERGKSIRNSVSTLAMGFIAPSILQNTNLFANRISANDKINVGLIGGRNMGWINLSDFLIHREVECVALCDID